MSNIQVLDSVSEPGSSNKPNEDAFFISPTLIVVIDGATGLGRKLIPESETDAAWFSRSIIEGLKKKWAGRGHFLDVLRAIVEDIHVEYTRHVEGVDVEPFEPPSAALSAFALEYGKPVIYQIGDCSVMEMYGNHRKYLFNKSRLFEFDEINMQINELMSKVEPNLLKRRQLILPSIKHVRSMMNTKDGYNILSVDPESVNGFERTVLDLDYCKENGRRFLLCSDGFSTLDDDYEASSVMDRLLHRNPPDLAAMVDSIREIENSDPEGKKFARFKKSDDSTAVMFRVE